MEIEKLFDSEDVLLMSSSDDFGVDDGNSPELARIENVKRWRTVAVRGAGAARFRAGIKSIYRDTCLFTGQRLPKLDSIASAGVDAAHILPWASYELNALDNEICLSKQCHWAFDSGVIKFSFDDAIKQYIISIPDIVTAQASQHNFSLSAYQKIVGSIPHDRLPTNPNTWPNPKYLESINKIMFP
ncbi:MAG: HNH endonuclease signature motif containing protein [Cyanobacteria bacterium P01_G01_bin.54]